MKKFVILGFIVILVGALALASCGGGGSQGTQAPGAGGGAAGNLPTPPPQYAGKTNPLQGNAQAIQAGKEIFTTNCSSCHGDTAEGNGPAAASLDPKPADLKVVTKGQADDYIFWRISEGGNMPPFNSAMPSWKGILSEEQIWQVISYIRSIAQ